MIFRITAKLGKKIGVAPSRVLPPEENPFADWTAHLFTAQRVQYVIVTNTASLYSTVMYARGMTDEGRFLKMALSELREFMTGDGNGFLYQRVIAPETASVCFSKTGNRRVLGSINDLVFQAKILLAEGDMSPYDVSFQLNETPMSFLHYGYPKKAFQALTVGKPEASDDSLENCEE